MKTPAKSSSEHRLSGSGSMTASLPRWRSDSAILVAILAH
jgi:hypothetical protein